MAIPKASFHARSVSLPSTSHPPVDASIKDQLRRLRASQAGPSSSSTICQNLFVIKNLYEQMIDSIQLPHNQKVVAQEVEEVLDGSLSLLDVSSSAMDALSLMKESVLELKSALRRGSDTEGIQAYLLSRKKLYKIVSKCLANLKKFEKSCEETDASTLRMLKEAESISFSTLKSVLSYLMGKKSVSRWSLVTKLVKSKNISCEVERTSEVEEVDQILSALADKHSGFETKAVLKTLETFQMTILELEDCLQCVSRCLVKTRVSLLNVLN